MNSDWNMILKHSFLSGLIFNLVLSPWTSANPVTSRSETLLQFADQLFNAQNYQESITEYWRFLYFHPAEPLAFYAYYKAAMAYKQGQELETAIQLFRHALQYDISLELRQRIRYQLAITLLAHGDLDLAQLELFKLSATDSTGLIANAGTLFYSLLLIYKKNWAEARAAIAKARIHMVTNKELDQHLHQVETCMETLCQHPEKSPGLAKWLATVVPGSGQMYAGNLLSGLNALALNATTSYFVLNEARQKNYSDACLLFLFVWSRYYLGNRSHAEEAAIRANQKYQQKILDQVYQLLQQASQYLPSTDFSIEWQDVVGEN